MTDDDDLIPVYSRRQIPKSFQTEEQEADFIDTHDFSELFYPWPLRLLRALWRRLKRLWHVIVDLGVYHRS